MLKKVLIFQYHLNTVAFLASLQS